MRHFKQTLLCCVALTATAGAVVRADDDPLEPLNRRVGAWDTEVYQKKAAWTPEPQTSAGEETVRWVLDKKFIQGEVLNKDSDAKGRFLVMYDADAKVYRSWFFGNQPGQFPRGETVGRWDPKKERMNWKMDFGDGLRGEMYFQYTGQDKMEWAMTIHDAAGALMMDIGGVQTRKK